MSRRGDYLRLLVSIAGVVLLLAVVARRCLLRVEVQGQSMAPGLLPGDRLLAVKGLRTRVGDVVTAADPRQPSRLLVKRVVARGAGDQVSLAGDNPAASTDSRSFGPVPATFVSGRVLWRYRPSDRRGRPSPPEGRDRPAVRG